MTKMYSNSINKTVKSIFTLLIPLILTIMTVFFYFSIFLGWELDANLTISYLKSYGIFAFISVILFLSAWISFVLYISDYSIFSSKDLGIIDIKFKIFLNVITILLTISCIFIWMTMEPIHFDGWLIVIGFIFIYCIYCIYDIFSFESNYNAKMVSEQPIKGTRNENNIILSEKSNNNQIIEQNIINKKKDLQDFSELLIIKNVSNTLLEFLSILIYEKISKIEITDRNIFIESILEEMANKKEFKRFKNELLNYESKKLFFKIVNDLIEIIELLRNLSVIKWKDEYFYTTGQINKNATSDFLWEKGIRLHYENKESFYRTFNVILTILIETFPNLNLIISFNKDRNELDAISKYKKKLYIILNIYNGGLSNGCQQCSTGIENLPGLDFHHSEKSLKGSGLKYFGLKYRKKIDELIKNLEQEGVILLCANCHSKHQAKMLNFFESIILEKDLLNLSSEDIDFKIKEYTDKLIKTGYLEQEFRHQYIQRVYHWIKKRIIIEQLFSGTCIGCRSVGIENLEAFDFHHITDINNKSKWEDLKNLDINTIIETIKNERMVCLCSNCHRLLKGNAYIENINIIFQGYPNDFLNHIRDYSNLIKSNINKYQYPLMRERLSFERKTIHDRWEETLIDIYLYLLHMNRTTYDLVSLEQYLQKKGKTFGKETLRGRNNRILEAKCSEMVRDAVRDPRRGIHQPSEYRLTKKGYQMVQSLLG